MRRWFVETTELLSRPRSRIGVQAQTIGLSLSGITGELRWLAGARGHFFIGHGTTEIVLPLTLASSERGALSHRESRGDLQEANAASLRPRGYAAADVNGMNVVDWDARYTREQLEENAKIGWISAVFEMQHRCKDGPSLRSKSARPGKARYSRHHQAGALRDAHWIGSSVTPT